MFAFPVTVPIYTAESIYRISVSIAIDDVAVVKPLLDKDDLIGVYDPLTSLIPATEIIMVDGRRLPVTELPASIIRYLDAYRSLEDFHTGRAATVDERCRDKREGNVIPLFSGGPCASSEGSTPV